MFCILKTGTQISSFKAVDLNLIVSGQILSFAKCSCCIVILLDIYVGGNTADSAMLNQCLGLTKTEAILAFDNG